MSTGTKKQIVLTPQQQKVLTDIVFAETAGGPTEEVQAAASAYLNGVRNNGFERAALSSSAFKFGSKQYAKASTGNLTPYEAKVYSQHAQVLNTLLQKPEEILPYTNHENIKAYGEPSWAKGQTNYKDIGRQRFYVIGDSSPRVKAVKK